MLADAIDFELLPAVPELILVVAGLGLLIIGALRGEEGGRLLSPLAILALIVAAVAVIGLDKRPIEGFTGHFRFDAFSAYFKVLILIGAAGGIALSQSFMEHQKLDRFEFPVLAVFAALGMCLMVSADSLLGLYMGLELQSLAFYVLAAFDRDSLRSSEAGLKYFILGALASGILLYGCSLVYGFTGTLSFEPLAARFAEVELPAGAIVGLVFVLAGLAFKLAAVPFHMWTPDVYEGAPTPVTALLAAAPKVAAIGLTVRVLMQPFGDHVAEWQQVVILISIASMVLGAFAAIGQRNIKRLLAYSSIGHIGYALVGVAAGTEQGIFGVLVYMAIYMVMTLGTFGCVLMMRRQQRYVEGIEDLSGLSTRQPMLAFAIAVFMFSLAGLPPLAGFFGKLYVFIAAIEAGLWWLALIGVVTSVVGAYYYLRVVKLMYFDQPSEAFDRWERPALASVVAITAAVTLLFILVPGPILSTAQVAAAAFAR